MKKLLLLLPFLAASALASAPQTFAPQTFASQSLSASVLPGSPPVATVTVTPSSAPPNSASVVSVPVMLAASRGTPPRLSGVEANWQAVAAGPHKLALMLTLKNNLPHAIQLVMRRDNEQNCTYAPTVQATSLGSAVVYPDRNARPRICTQEIQANTLAAGGSISYTRELELPAGEYTLEGGWLGLANGAWAQVFAPPLRVVVR